MLYHSRIHAYLYITLFILSDNVICIQNWELENVQVLYIRTSFERVQKYMCQKLWHKPKGDDSLRVAKMKSKM